MMARKDAHNVRPSMSSDARDKLMAALHWHVKKGDDDYHRAPMYFDALQSGTPG